MAPHVPPPSGRPGGAVAPLDVLVAAARVRVTVIVGASDTGKTSLAAGLAGALAARGERVAVVDADVGQSEVGPPTTVGLGRVTGVIARLGQADVVALEFIGDTSPVRHIRETSEATGRLVRRALAAGFERVIVDTGGLVQGALGVALKRAKLRAIDPDLVVVVQRRDESEPLAAALEAGARPAVVRLAAATEVVRRGQQRRREHRERALRDYFAAAADVVVDTARVPLVPRRDETLAGLVPDLLMGVRDAAGETVGIARLKSVDTASGRLVIRTPVAPERIAALVPGRATWRE